MAKKKQKYYVVWAGHQPGIYYSWPECLTQTKGFEGAKYKSFPTLEEATLAFRGNYYDFVAKKGRTKVTRTRAINSRVRIVWKSISVDAACGGNPGKMEYQGVNTKTGEQYFHQQFELGTNNIGEFLAIVHALAMLEKQNIKLPIYSDSKTAMAWVQKKKANTKLQHTARTAALYELIHRAEHWLKTHDFRVPLLKWDTKSWGEIPADFGRK
ncbi:MAG: ribonuclease H family protein [Bacteroidota bacterium]